MLEQGNILYCNISLQGAGSTAPFQPVLQASGFVVGSDGNLNQLGVSSGTQPNFTVTVEFGYLASADQLKDEIVQAVKTQFSQPTLVIDEVVFLPNLLS